MRLFGLTIGREKALAPEGSQAAGRSAGWWDFIIREPYTGAWQRNEELKLDTALANSALFRCVSLISGDIAKMRCRLVARQTSGIWTETESAAFSPVLRKPNGYQNRIQFFQSWMASKLNHGNTYVLKERDNRGVVVALHVLDPKLVVPLTAPDGSVWYQPQIDWLAGVSKDDVALPASEIIHDRWNCFFHPLVGLSPVYACGLAAMQSVTAQRHATRFFKQGAKPGGVLTSPHAVTEEQLNRLKDTWEKLFTGDNVGKTAILTNGMKYEATAVTADDSKLIETLKWSDETVCGAFGVPPYMAGVGAAPLNNNVASQNTLYYSQALQIHVESIELCLDEGLGLTAAKDGVLYGTEFDLSDLLRMDPAMHVEVLAKSVAGAIHTPNEARAALGLPPVTGGDTVYLQQQNYSLAALDRRDSSDDPFGKASQAATDDDQPATEEDDVANDNAAEAAKAVAAVWRTLALARRG